MAPIPKDNQEHPPPSEDDPDFLNPSFNMATADLTSDSSSDEENNDSYTNNSSYMLLPQEPDGANSSESEDDGNYVGYVRSELPNMAQNGSDNNNQSPVISDQLPDEVIQGEDGAVAAPTVNISSTSSCSLHPDFLAKFPDGKVPSYMQVPAAPKPNSKDMLWNKGRSEKGSSDSVQENNIRKAMASFSLPSENVPDWAKQMTSDQWNNVIAKQISPSSHIPQKDDNDSSLSHQSVSKSQEEWVAEFPDT